MHFRVTLREVLLCSSNAFSPPLPKTAKKIVQYVEESMVSAPNVGGAFYQE